MDSKVPSKQVVEAIAHKEGVSATELSPPLYNAVDPEALDALVQPDTHSDTEGIEIEFEYLNYAVRVESGSRLRISVRNGDAVSCESESVPEQGAAFQN